MKLVKISKEKPPQWILDAVKKQFNVEWESGVIFTYGETISNNEGLMTEDLISHETYHTVQQEKFGGKDKWWEEYLQNPQFRYEQELECYQRQYKWVIANIKNRQEVFKLLQHYARCLSGEMYGNVVTFNEALSQIKNYE